MLISDEIYIIKLELSSYIKHDFVFAIALW